MLFFLIGPWFLWNTRWGYISIVVLLILNCDSLYINRKRYPYLYLLQFSYLIYAISCKDYKIFIQVFLLLLFFHIRDSRCVELFYNLKKILAIFLVPSIISYILVVYFDYTMPSTFLEPLNIVKDYNYTNYYFFIDDNLFTIFERFHSYFDEPGVLGTIGGMLLVADNYNLKNKYNIIIFLGCILTFSFYFYMLSIIYFLLKDNNRNKIILLLLILLIIIVLFSIEYFDPLTNRFLIEDGELSGDNRTGHYFDIWYDDFIHSSNVWFGLGAGECHKLFPGGSSYKYIIGEYGIIFFILYCFSFFMLAFKTISQFNYLVIWCLIFFSCMYQRPAILNFIYPIIWFLSIFSLKNNCSSSTYVDNISKHPKRFIN